MVGIPGGREDIDSCMGGCIDVGIVCDERGIGSRIDDICSCRDGIG